MHFSLICIIILIIRINTHSGRETQSSQRERGGTLEKQKAMCRKIMKGQPSTVSDVAVLVSSSSLQPANCYTKACRRISWNLETTMNYIRSASLLRRHPTHFVSSSLFTVQLSVCTYGGGFKGRAKWYSMRECECERGGIKGERRRGGWGEGDSGGRCCEDSGIVGDLFCSLVFLFPSSFPHLFQVQKNKRVDIQHWCGEARQMTKRSTPCHCCHLCVGVFMPVFGCVCVYVCTPLGTRQTVQTFCSQGQTHQGPEGFLTVLLVGRVPIVLYFYWQRFYIILFSFICSKTIFFSPPSWVNSSIHILSFIWLGSSEATSLQEGWCWLVVGMLSPLLEAPLKYQLSVWKRDNLTDQSGISSFIIHSEPIQ